MKVCLPGARLALRAGIYTLFFWACLASAQTQPQQIFVKPGDVVSIPLPVENASDSGADISGVTVNIAGDATFVTNPQPSSTNPVPVGQTVTFTPSFTVGNVPDGTYTISLKVVTTDVLDPDASDPAQDTSVSFPRLYLLEVVPLVVEKRLRRGRHSTQTLVSCPFSRRRSASTKTFI